MNEKELKIYLGQKIKEYRNKLQLTQDQLSEKIEISQRQMSLIEVGKCFPKPETILKISNVLGCSCKDLFDFETDSEIEDLKNELIDIINILPKDKIKTLHILVKRL